MSRWRLKYRRPGRVASLCETFESVHEPVWLSIDVVAHFRVYRDSYGVRGSEFTAVDCEGYCIDAVHLDCYGVTPWPAPRYVQAFIMLCFPELWCFMLDSIDSWCESEETRADAALKATEETYD